MSLVPIVPSSFVQAQNNEKVVYADGEYTLPFEILESNSDKTSAAEGYTEKPAKLIVKNGKYTVQMTITNSSYWQYFKVQSGDDFVDVKVVEELEGQDERRVVEFEVEDLNQFLNAKIHIFVPLINYEGKYDIRIKFDTSQLPVAPDEEPEPEEPANPGQPEEPGNGNEEPANPEQPEKPGDENKATPIEMNENEDYAIEFRAKHAEKDNDSAVARYLNNPAKLIAKNGKVYVTLTINNHTTVTGFQVENNGELVNPIKEKVNAEKNTREVTYELDQLLDTMKAQVQYKMGAHVGDQPLRLVFKKETLEKVQWVNFGESVTVETGKTVRILDTNIAIAMPNDLPVGTEIQVNLKEANDIPATVEDLKVAGSVIDVTLTFPAGHENYQGKYTLTLPYDKNNYDADKVAIYYFNEGKKEWEKQANSKVDSTNGTVSVDVDHFSTYGVLADVSVTNEDNSGDSDSDNGDSSGDNGSQPDNKKDNPPQKVCSNGEYTIPVEVLDGDTGNESAANQYIKDNEGKLIIQNGKFKVQLTITSSSYWNEFKVLTPEGYKDVRVVSEDNTANTRVVEFDVVNPNELLPAKVHIVVPAINYDKTYDILLKFDLSNLNLGNCLDDLGSVTDGSGSQGGSATNDEDRLAFNRGDDASSDNKNTSALNPKTADKTKLFLFLSLLVASLIPLAIQIRKKLRSTNA